VWVELEGALTSREITHPHTLPPDAPSRATIWGKHPYTRTTPNPAVPTAHLRYLSASHRQCPLLVDAPRAPASPNHYEVLINVTPHLRTYTQLEGEFMPPLPQVEGERARPLDLTATDSPQPPPTNKKRNAAPSDPLHLHKQPTLTNRRLQRPSPSPPPTSPRPPQGAKRHNTPPRTPTARKKKQRHHTPNARFSGVNIGLINSENSNRGTNIRSSQQASRQHSSNQQWSSSRDHSEIEPD
jgi:hypothetical protein